MSALVGAYMCPRGAYLIECRFRSAGLQVLRVVPAPGRLGDAGAAAAHLVNALASTGLRRSRIAIALRGFEVGHHVLSLPPATAAVLAPVVEREVRRLEPQISDHVVGWTQLPAEAPAPDVPPQTQVLAAAAPQPVISALEHALRAAGHTLLHLTALPAAVQRLHEEFEGSDRTTAMVLPLPDGAFLGFFLQRALRLAVEPPLQDAEVDALALAEELELGSMFVRQQFRGTQVDDVVLAAPSSVLAHADQAIAHKLSAPVSRLDVQGLGAAELVALGALLDSRAAQPLALAGTAAAEGRTSVRGRLRAASVFAVLVAVLVAGWAVYEAISAHRTTTRLVALRREVERQSFGVRPMRETADQRKLMRDAIAALRFSGRERLELVRALGQLADAVTPPVALDSIRLDRGTDGWVGAVSGSVTAETNGRAVQALQDFYRYLPARVSVEQLNLERLSYDDAPAAGTVRFQLSFVLPMRADVAP